MSTEVTTRQGIAGTVDGNREDGYGWTCYRGHKSTDRWATEREAVYALSFHADEGECKRLGAPQ